MDNDTYQGWLRCYNMAKSIKSPVINDNKRRLPLAEGVFEAFIENITNILLKSDAYLDSKGYHMPKPLWVYNSDDPTTWASNPYFAYSHLL